MTPEVRHLRAVLAVAKHGSLTKACGELHLSQPALSQQLQLLEHRLGAPLFHRLGKRMMPTAIGERVLISARAVIAELEQLADDVRRLTSGQETLLRLGTQCYTAFHWLPGILASYVKKYPTVDVQIIGDATHEPERALLDGRIDLGIINRPGHDPRLQYLPLFDDELVVIVAAGHRFAKCKYVTAEELANEHVFSYQVPQGHESALHAVLRAAGIHGRRVTEVQWTDAIVEFVKAGMGVGVLARWAARASIQSGQLHAVPLTRDGFQRSWSAVTLAQTELPPHVQDLITALTRGPKAKRNASSHQAMPSPAIPAIATPSKPANSAKRRPRSA